ncbi:MAG: type IV pilin protein [Wenzhouxiangella sp.]
MKASGFTLIELMIVIAILAILTAIAVPIYTNQVEKTRRADAVSALLTTAQELERCFTRTNTYQNCIDPATFDSDDEYYKVTVTAGATTYALEAAPQNAQSGDACGKFELDHLGNRKAASDTDRCWGSD